MKGALTTLDQRIRFAIAHKRLLQVTYKGQPRVVEPHDYGVLKGSIRLLVFQLIALPPGPGRNPSTPGWRLLHVDRIEACEVQAATFGGSRGRAHRTHYQWDELFCRVE